MPIKKTTTSAFGISKRESHDASAFYARNLYREQSTTAPATNNGTAPTTHHPPSTPGPTASTANPPPP